MMVRYWSPFQEVESLRRQLDRVFDEVTSTLESTAAAAWSPAIRLWEDGSNYYLTAQLAGIHPDDIDIQVTREAIAISGERKQPEAPEGARVLHDDWRYGSFRRVINFPEGIQNDAVAADFNNGILMLTLPKVEEARQKVVKVDLSQRLAAGQQSPAELNGQNGQHQDTPELTASASH